MRLTEPYTFVQLPAYAVARTVVPYFACMYPLERASAIERTTKVPTGYEVLQVPQLSFAPFVADSENAHTLPEAHAPTEASAADERDADDDSCGAATIISMSSSGQTA